MPEPSYPVRELVALVRRTLDVCFPDDVWVEGEIAGITRRRNGHVFFQLVDPGPPGRQPEAALDVVLFDEARREVNARLERAGGAIRMVDGVRIRISGRLDLFPRSSRIQLKMRDIDPAFTLAHLTLARDEVLRSLKADGLLERNRSRPLPPMPLRLGVVTSLGSAAHADLLHELERSGLAWRIVQCDAAVQGVGAEASLVAALGMVVAAGVDVVAIVRGGGARTDLSTFDAEGLARAVATCPVPVFTGIGHETDRSVVDEVAAVAAKTPTACAAALVEHCRHSIDLLDERWATVRRGLHDAYRTADRRLDNASHGVTRSTGRHLSRAAERLTARGEQLRTTATRAARTGRARVDDRMAALEGGTSRALRDAHRILVTTERRVEAHDPARVLARGWSLTRTVDGRVVRRVTDVGPGNLLLTTVGDGVLHSTLIDSLAPPPTDDDA